MWLYRGASARRPVPGRAGRAVAARASPTSASCRCSRTPRRRTPGAAAPAWVHEAMLADFPDLTGHEVYVCGSAKDGRGGRAGVRRPGGWPKRCASPTPSLPAGPKLRSGPWRGFWFTSRRKAVGATGADAACRPARAARFGVLLREVLPAAACCSGVIASHFALAPGLAAACSGESSVSSAPWRPGGDHRRGPRRGNGSLCSREAIRHSTPARRREVTTSCRSLLRIGQSPQCAEGPCG